MKKQQYALTLLIFGAMLVVVSCNRTSSATNANGIKPQNANSGAPGTGASQPGASPRPAEPAPAKGPTSPPQLVGAYEMKEVHDRGVVNLISELKTVILFTADGSYTRSSSKKDRVYHTDSGKYQIEGQDNLVLTIQMSKTGLNSKIHSTPLKKTHKFMMSESGEELRLISDDGKVAIFRRTAGLGR